jgi:hypothetical protein
MDVSVLVGEFLSCRGNKSKFIKGLAGYLTTKGFKKTHAEGDADLLIIKTAIMASKTSKTVLIGEYTDLLCLFLNYSKEKMFILYLKSETKSGKLGKCGM